MGEQDIQAFSLYYDAWCADRLAGLRDVKPFEFFCADQFLKDRLLTDTEILSGQVDAPHDGGVDSFYCFFNGRLIDDTTEIDPRGGGDVEIKVMQSKQGAGFSPTAINKFRDFIEDLLTLSREPADYCYTYHEKLTRLIGIFKEKFLELQKRSTPTLSVEFFFITRLDVDPNRNAMRTAERVVEEAAQYYSQTTVEPFRFVNVADLWTQCKVTPPEKKLIPLVQSFATSEGYVGLVSLRSFYEFLKGPKPGVDGHPQIDANIFEANVRGYQLHTSVNKRITDTLKKGVPEFWLLNNGITILTPEAIHSTEGLSIKNPQIVNGLQTSQRIFDYFNNTASLPVLTDGRRILIRVIQTSDEDIRNEIIRATNDQNSMPAEALISTFRIQHQIEIFFERHGLFYDRRKGHYKALRKPAKDIVSVLDLMQAVICILLRKPDDARGRPRDYLKDNKRQLIFGADDKDEEDDRHPYGLDVYLRCVQIVRKVESYLSEISADRKTALNVRFYMALDLAAGAVKNAYCPPGKIIGIDVERDLTEAVLGASYKRILKLYEKFGGDDSAAKGKDFIAVLNKSLTQRYSPPRKGRRAKR